MKKISKSKRRLISLIILSLGVILLGDGSVKFINTEFTFGTVHTCTVSEWDKCKYSGFSENLAYFG